MLLPLGVMLSRLFEPQTEIWQHLWQYVLPQLLRNTLYLGTSVAIGVLLLGALFGWLTTAYDFPARRFFAWALLLPLAMPTYVMAFVWLGLLDFSGPIQTQMRQLLGNDVSLPSVRAWPVLAIVMIFALYPYVYMLARQAFLTQGQRAIEVGQSLGASRTRIFWRITLPMARPWLMGGMFLALMECLADFGAVSIFNVDTFTTAIYKTWFSLFNLTAATQLAAFLLLGIMGILVLERLLRGQAQYGTLGRSALLRPKQLSPARGWAAFSACALLLLLAFGVPLLQLITWAWSVVQNDWDSRYVAYMERSLSLSALSALLIVLLALVVAYCERIAPGKTAKTLVLTATTGYALPGSILAVAVYVPIAWFDDALYQSGLPWAQTLMLKGTLVVLLVAYGVRFLTVAFQPIQNSLLRVTASQEQFAIGLGLSRWAILRRVHFPQIRVGLITAGLLVFVEVMKEMPMTLMTRPFGWETLAVRVFEMTSEGEWERAALPSLVIVLVGLIPIFLLSKTLERK